MFKKISNSRLSLAIITLAFVAASCSSSQPASPSSGSSAQSQAANANTNSTGDFVAQADKFYAQREDLTHVREGLVVLRQARAADYNNYDAAWRLAKFNYYLGAHTPNTEESDKAFRDGVEAGRAAVKLQDEKPDGHFWLGANLGGQAQKSSLSGLASTEEIRREMETVIKLDEGYMAGSAYMALGQVELELPRLMGGDPQKAVEYFEKGLKFGENNLLLHLNLAKAYLAVKRTADARKQLNLIVNAKPDPDFLPEYNEAATEARKLLEANS